MVEREREVIHEERPTGTGGDNTAVIIIGAVLALVALVIIVMLIGGRGGDGGAGEEGGDVNIEAPEVDVPDEVDVEVDDGGGGGDAGGEGGGGEGGLYDG